jgi:Fe-S oxidoreductase
LFGGDGGWCAFAAGAEVYALGGLCLFRQRIASYKEIKRLQGMEHRTAEEEARLKSFTSSYEYDGNATCAADGMCQEKCPVKINTGE